MRNYVFLFKLHGLSIEAILIIKWYYKPRNFNFRVSIDMSHNIHYSFECGYAFAINLISTF
jgi:hypothetical protein